MSADIPGQPGAAQPFGAGGGQAPSEEELRAAYEAELARITATDVIAQTAVSLLNLAAQRLRPAPRAGAEAAGPASQTGEEGVDLEQVRDAIDATRAMLDILERRIPQEVRPLRDALSQLQMAYAAAVRSAGGEQSEAGTAPAGAGAGAGAGGSASETAGHGSAPGAPAEPGGSPGERPGGAGAGAGEGKEPGPGPAESSGRLWVPGR
jgi:hypothetical protein